MDELAPTAANKMSVPVRGFGVLNTFGFFILNCVVGQVATGRSWHSASLHCQALLFSARYKHQRYDKFHYDTQTHLSNSSYGQ